VNVEGPSGIGRAYQGFGCSLINRYIGASGGQQYPASVGGASVHRAVTEYGSDGVHRQFGAGQGQQDGGCVVDARVGVDNNSFQFASLSFTGKMPRIISPAI
jgi:hypothetical protein